MSALAILDCGPGTTIQDHGRQGHRRYGVSSSGAMDRLALAVANALVGKEPGAAAIEFALLGGRFRIEGSDALLACSGAEMTIDGQGVPAGRSALAPAGARVAIGPAREGVYAYLAAAGGLATPPVMESRSMHRRSGIGGGLAPGGRLSLGDCDGRPFPRQLAVRPRHEDGPIRVMPGPQDDVFSPEEFERFLSTSFTIDAMSDRMGYRLDGARIEHRHGYNIVSDGVLPGSVQVPGDGRPIVLMRDCQTTGGYPKIATVISADVDRLAQRPAGSPVTFRRVGREEAVAAAREFEARLAGLVGAAAPLAIVPTTDALLAHNLVSGVVDGRPEPL